jgi:hypothetical protein
MTVRPDGRPQVTPVVAVWLDGAVHFTTGPTERKAHNLAQKYESPFRLTVRDSAFYSRRSKVLVYRVTPTKAFGYGRGERFSATRWRF